MLVTDKPQQQKQAFKLKSSFSSFTVLHLQTADLTVIKDHLEKTTAKAPDFFSNIPIVLDVTVLQDLADTIDIAELKAMLLAHGMVPIGVRTGSIQFREKALEHMIPSLPQERTPAAKQAAKETAEPEPIARPTKVVTMPVRSGKQVYAKDSDLLVIAPVSNGAEIIADGNIHVYGPLRGRALAGVKGNENAHIFCTSLQAELLSIAGRYLVSEDIKPIAKGDSMIHVYLEDDHIKYEPL